MIVDVTAYTTGFCDRLRLVTFCMAVALCRKDTVLYLKESTNEYCPYRFMDLCEIEGFELRPWNESCPEAELSMRKPLYPNLSHVQSRKPRDIELSDESFLNLWRECYQRLRPRQFIHPKIDSLGLGPDYLGLHIRFTDKIQKIGSLEADLSVIFKQAVPAVEKTALRLLEARSKRYGLRKVFIASDDEPAKTAWIKKLQSKGWRIVSHRAAYEGDKLRQTSGEDFIVDLFSLARCRVIVGTTRSGVVRSAAWIGGAKCVYAVDSVPSVVVTKKIMSLYKKIKRCFYELRRKNVAIPAIKR